MGKKGKPRVQLPTGPLSAGITRLAPKTKKEDLQEEVPLNRPPSLPTEKLEKEKKKDPPTPKIPINEILQGFFAFLGFGFLSDVCLSDVMFPTIHHAVTWARYGKSPQFAEELNRLPVTDIDDYAEKYEEDETWLANRYKILEAALRDKFMRNREIRQKLAETGSRSILFNDPYGHQFDSSYVSKLFSVIRKDLCDNSDLEQWCSCCFSLSEDPTLRPDVTLVESKPGNETPLRQVEVNRNSSLFFVGKLETSDLMLFHDSISRLHGVLLFVDPSRIAVVDLQSKAHTYVNDTELAPFRINLLADGDVLRFGGSSRRYTVQLDPCKLLERLARKKHELQEKISRMNTAETHDPFKLQTVNTRKIYISNVPFSATEHDLRDFFVSVGQIVEIVLPQYNDYSRNRASRGIAFVTFKEVSQAFLALNMNQAQLHGRKLQIVLAERKEKKRVDYSRRQQKGSPERKIRRVERKRDHDDRYKSRRRVQDDKSRRGSRRGYRSDEDDKSRRGSRRGYRSDEDDKSRRGYRSDEDDKSRRGYRSDEDDKSRRGSRRGYRSDEDDKSRRGSRRGHRSDEDDKSRRGSLHRSDDEE